MGTAYASVARMAEQPRLHERVIALEPPLTAAVQRISELAAKTAPPPAWLAWRADPHGARHAGPYQGRLQPGPPRRVSPLASSPIPPSLNSYRVLASCIEPLTEPSTRA